ncbi:insecticidal toxin complex protein [Streptomyces sp. SID4919]|uniref:Tc toxin subunit A-related protein n=1 Tax=unclassified Streptomyces TaxID=2593676 RepID=UPI000823B5AA|nr:MULTISPECIES: neuraminidase-like domain-containing protein [unclassified Streptomyces]MYY08031.1 insecticidal toxin complex protein [Streptomyces sp. SID4919]SCK08198.1 hypothetical protein YW7DRAFT_00343 [Streptomyces sp. AmelKG-E11A]
MADLIILRLHPAEPMAASDFTALLGGLTITAYDLSFTDSRDGVPLGTASGLADPHLTDPTDDSVTLTSTSLLQHYIDITDPLTGAEDRRLESVATAVLVAAPPAGHPEYPTPAAYDIRLDVTTGAGSAVTVRHLDFNITVTTVGTLPTDQTACFAMAASAYLPLPATGAGTAAGIAHVDLPPGGAPPAFAPLVQAIDLVLGRDPGPPGGSLLTRGPLAPAESRHVASEIAWNRAAYPPPRPDPTLGQDPFGALYTEPPVDPAVGADALEKARPRFEAEQSGYYGTREAEALRLAGYVHAASAAVAQERISAAADRAWLDVPLLVPGPGGPAGRSAAVAFTGDDGLTPPFTVPAAVFYALSATMPVQVGPQQRYDMARLALEEHTLTELTTAVDDSVVTLPAAPLTDPAAAPVTAVQAARRLRALGTPPGTVSELPLAPPFDALVTDWLAHTGPTATLRDDFWVPEATARPGTHLDLVLAAVTGDHTPLITALKGPPHLLTTVAALVALTDQQWRDLFLGPPPPPGTPPRTALLPPFTRPGTPAERTEAFLRHLRTFLDVTSTSPSGPAPGAEPPPVLPSSGSDAFAAFACAYPRHAGGAAFSFDVPPDPAAVRATAADVLPGDPAAQHRLTTAVGTIGVLHRLTDIGVGELRFSLMEALYARGFTTTGRITALSAADFRYALTGSVAHPHASALHERAGAASEPGRTPSGPFRPVNPDGSLTDCVPPEHLSPLGAIAYLHELLQVSAASTRERPLRPDDPGRLGVLLTDRRGPLGELRADAAALTPLPTLDLVNESLERLAADIPHATGGAVHDTADRVLHGHRLRPHGTDEHPTTDRDGRPDLDGCHDPHGLDGSHGSHDPHDPHRPDGPHDPESPHDPPASDAPHDQHRPDAPHDPPRRHAHDPATLLAVVPEHSSPATPVAEPTAYERLRTDFGDPRLPYHQPFDVNRSYLGELRTTRLSAMRHFRRDITEFALDATHEPEGFRRHQWRYPLRLEAALEYLGIPPEEYDALHRHHPTDRPSEGRPRLRELYGFAGEHPGGRHWTDIVREVPEFLARTGLSYCEFLELWRSRCVPFDRAEPPCGEGGAGDGHAGHGHEDEEGRRGFPDCVPCCPDALVIDFGGTGERDTARAKDALRRLAVLVRLWRRLRARPSAALSFTELADTAAVLGLFSDHGRVDPDFVRQLSSLTLLRELLHLPLRDHEADPGRHTTGADRTHLLALWEGPGAHRWDWARTTLLDAVDRAAERRRPAPGRRPELVKVLTRNLDPLSVLAGFTPGAPTDTWHARPTATLRFAEILLKLHLSDFTVGEVLFLFSNTHLAGDDPFPLQTRNEALDHPFDLPDDDERHGLTALRTALLQATGDPEPRTWAAIAATLTDRFGYRPTAPDDALTALGEHLFPSVLEREGTPVPADRRRFAVPLPAHATNAAMWNTPPDGPLRYDTPTQTLWTRLPVSDAAVAEKLGTIRQLTPPEQDAVRDLQHAPAALLAPFALIFDDFPAALDRLRAEPGEEQRFAFLGSEFARFVRRCELIAEHLAAHVREAAGQDGPGIGPAETWRLLRSLHGDENTALTPWEDDSGAPPALTWPTAPTGGAFASLLGLTGTGLLGEYSVPGSGPVWRETRGPLTAFGADRDAWNAPVPTLVPALGLTLTPAQLRSVAVRNGFALRNTDGQPLLGAQPFTVVWRGTLLVEEPGRYEFHAGAPTPDGAEPDPERCPDHRWRLTLARRQKTWHLLNRGRPGEDAPDHRSGPVELRRGAYDITVELVHAEPVFTDEDAVRPRPTGFQIKYTGPDTGGRPTEVPRHRLHRDQGGAPLGKGLEATGTAAAFLRARRTSSLRDIRRTYQRAFKAALLVHRFALSARPLPGDPQSELGHLLDHPRTFRGTSHPRTGPHTFGTHHAWLAPDLLPVDDPFRTPSTGRDARTAPSPRRQAALFDLWERLFDHTALRAETRAARTPPAWRLYHAAVQRQPDDPAQLVRHLGVDIGHTPQVLTYYAQPTDHTVRAADLESEIWAVRVRRAEHWLDTLLRRFHPRRAEDARPHRWAADDPGEGPDAGNTNLTAFVRDGAFDHGGPRRYDEVRRLDDGLRTRARDALVTWLTGMNRIALPHGHGHATRARDLSDLLLQDVDAGPGERTSRIEDAIGSVQAFVQRARLGLEPDLTVPAELAALWDARFGTWPDWRRRTERDLHREDWIEWDELRRARRVEAFTFLESGLRAAKLTVAVPGGLTWWPGVRPPEHPGLTPLQHAVPSALRMLTPGPLPGGLDLLGTPDAGARPAWLAPTGAPTTPEPGDPTAAPDGEPPGTTPTDEPPNPGPTRLPLWIEATIRPGTRLVRVAAAGIPPADARPDGRAGDPGPCCDTCGDTHEPLVDEYWFWLQDAVEHRPVPQNADTGKDADENSDWHDPERLPTLLHWPPVPVVHLHWARSHRGAFQPPRRSAGAVAVGGPGARLVFRGRTADSLRFEVTGATAPPGHRDPAPPGFRHDLATDSAVTLPLVVPPPAKTPGTFPGGLDAHPYFAHVCPGAPVEPLSLFSVALTVGGTLETHGRFDAALKWYGLARDPLASDNAWSGCARHRPPTAAPAARARPTEPCCPALAPDDDRARERAVLLRWLEAALAWGDRLSDRGDPESLRRAKVVLGTVAQVLGDRPTTIRAVADGPPRTVASFTPAPGPLNPRLTALHDRLTDRLALLHTGTGPHRHRGAAPGTEPSHPDGDGFRAADEAHPGGPDTYRFETLIAKATELAGETRNLGNALLAAFEKGDAEHLASLRAAQERQLLELAVVDRQHAWREADWQVQALGRTKESAQTRLRHHQNLIAGGLNGGELGYESLTGISVASRAAGNVSEAIAQGVGTVPDFWIGVAGIAGTPLQFNQLPLGNKLASGFATAARILNAVGEISSSGAGLSLTQAGWERRLDDWRHQVTVTGIEIEQIERQILASERRRDIALRELDAARRQIENATAVQDFLRDRFTSHELYSYLQRETAGLYRRTYELAERAAHRAQRAFRRERGEPSRSFLGRGAWDNLREGLLAGDRLALSLRRMDQAYVEEDRREYELTKHVSLRLHLPAAYLALRTAGHTEFELPEWLFDLDHPGHYMRRIKNVTLTLPCVTGPYSGVHCRLTLLSSSTRVDPRLTPEPLGCCRPGPGTDGHRDGDGPGDDCRCRAAPTDPYTMRPADPRIVRGYAATEAIATSMGQNDAGLFELNFRDTRYLPFEYAGAVSRWRAELPRGTNVFDPDSLSDVILHLNYTAREGGEPLRGAATDAARGRLPGDGRRLLDVRRDLPDAWAALTRRGRERRELELALTPAMFPFVPARRVTRVDRIGVLVEAPGARPGAWIELVFRPAPHSCAGPCACERITVRCVAGGAFPGLFHGEVELSGPAPLGALGPGGPTRVGTFEFPGEPDRVRDVFLLLDYRARPDPDSREEAQTLMRNRSSGSTNSSSS